MPILERRPTDIQKIGKALMVGVCVSVPILMGGQLLLQWDESRSIREHRAKIQQNIDQGVQDVIDGKFR